MNSVTVALYKDYLNNNTQLTEQTKYLYNSVAIKLYKSIDELNKDNIYNFIIQQCYKRNNNYYRAGIKDFLKWYYTILNSDRDSYNKIIENYPKYSSPSRKRILTYLTPKQRTELFLAINEEWVQIIFLILQETGIRIGDCLNLKRESVILETNNERKLKLIVKGKRDIENICYIYTDWVIDAIIDFKIRNDYHTGYLFIKNDRAFNELNNFGKTKKNYNNCYFEVNKDITIIDDNKIFFKDTIIPKGTIIKVYRKELVDLNNIEGLKPRLQNVITLNEFNNYFKNDIDKFNITLIEEPFIIIDNFFKLKRRHYSYALHILKTATKQLGMEHHAWAWHDTRRCYATDIWLSTHDIKLLQQQLTHKRVETSMRYIESAGLKRIDADKDIQKLLHSNNNTI